MLKLFLTLMMLAVLAAAPVSAGMGRSTPDHATCQHWGDMAMTVAMMRDQGVDITQPLAVIERTMTPGRLSTDNYTNMIRLIYARPSLSPMDAKDLAKASCYASKPF